MSNDSRFIWANRLDYFCTITGALVPVGIVTGIVVFEAFIGLVSVCWIIRLFVAKDNLSDILKQTNVLSLIVPWMAWFLAIFLSLIANRAGFNGWAHDLAYIRYLIFIIALFDISKRLPVYKYILYGLIAGVIWGVLNTSAAYITGYDLTGKPLIRYTGKLKEAARIAGMVSFAAPFFISWGIFDEKLKRNMRFVLISIGLIAFAQLFQTHLRTDILASFSGLLFAMIYFFRNRISVKVAVITIVLLVSSVAVFFHIEKQWNLSTVYDRMYYWKVAYAMWKDHLIFGVGVDSYQETYKQVAATGLIKGVLAPDGRIYFSSETCHAHSLVLMLLSCNGILGLAAFLWLFVNATLIIFKNAYGWGAGLITWPVVLIIIGITGHNIYHSWYQALLAYFIVMIGNVKGISEKYEI